MCLNEISSLASFAISQGPFINAVQTNTTKKAKESHEYAAEMENEGGKWGSNNIRETEWQLYKKTRLKQIQSSFWRNLLMSFPQIPTGTRSRWLKALLGVYLIYIFFLLSELRSLSTKWKRSFTDPTKDYQLNLQLHSTLRGFYGEFQLIVIFKDALCNFSSRITCGNTVLYSTVDGLLGEQWIVFLTPLWMKASRYSALVSWARPHL